MPADAAALAQEDTLLRRVLHRPDFLEWHDDLDRWVPSLASVRFDPDGMSAFVPRLLSERGHDANDVATLGGTNPKPAVVYEFDQAAVQDAGFDVGLSPNEDTPIGYAHASITRPVMANNEERNARTRLATRMNLVHGQIQLPKPDGA